MSSFILAAMVGLGAVDVGKAFAQPMFSPPSLLNAGGMAVGDTGDDTDPSLATDGAGVWVAVWSSVEDLDGSGTDADIFVARSTDNGATWDMPDLLNSFALGDTGED
ncbi:MAG TPA: exo-alpha-sialidase, partial [Candidatus Hydrogenedentes bacterium]|nr:exo-alpha-sialidase [Candidatus Hydrogenedentota bacterium]